MYKGITFLDDVTTASRQNILNFVKNWYSNKSHIEVKTSGSTGEPKLIKLDKKHIKTSINATVSFFNLKPKNTILLAMSIDYIAGKLMLLRALESNLKIIIANPTANPLLQLKNQKIDFSGFVPMQVNTILKDPLSKEKYEKIKQVIIGGAPITIELENKLKLLSNNSYATFGMTETISHIAVRNINLNESYYTTLNQVKISVDKESCLKIEAKDLLDKPIQTNDIVDLINDHQFVWKGRANFVINSGGIKLHPEEIENKIQPFIPHNNFYLIGQKDELLGERLVLKIESDSKFDTIKLLNKLKTVLGKYESPKQILLVDKFITTASGKVKRT